MRRVRSTPPGGKTVFLLLLLTAALASPSLLVAQTKGLPVPPELEDPKLDIAWNRYYDYPELVELLVKINRAYPDKTRLEKIGESSEGRDLWVLTVFNPATGPDTSKPAMWVDANVHGNEVQGGEACLYLAWYLLENYGDVPAVTELLDRASFYIFPTVNPDGRAWWFQAPNTASSSRSGKKPTDNDGDGLLDEDGYDDLDGDGEILRMRKEDPFGRWKIDPDDPRLMVRVGPDERGTHTQLGLEGIDNDGDGRVNEDGPGGYDMNRNWPGDWQPNYVQFGAGEYPFSYPETRAVGEFILARPHIAAVQSFHNAGGMVLRGPGVESSGPYPRSDVQVYDLIGKRGEEMLPFYNYWIIWKDLYSVYGGFVTWTYESLGIFSFTNELWNNKQLYNRDQSPSQKERITFNDRLRSGMDFVEWKPFDHPTYGRIEIGGYRKTVGRVAPSFLIEEMSHRNALFCIYHAVEMPDISFGKVEVKPLSDGRSRIDAEVLNARQIPTISAQGQRRRAGLPDLLELQSNDVKVVFSADVTSLYPERLSPHEARPGRIENWRGVSFAAPYRVRFVVEGKGAFRLSYRSQKGGTITADGRVGP